MVFVDFANLSTLNWILNLDQDIESQRLNYRALVHDCPSGMTEVICLRPLDEQIRKLKIEKTIISSRNKPFQSLSDD